MSRTLAFIGALALTGAVASTAAYAQPQGPGYYAATPVEAPTKTSVITRDTLWKLNGTAFTAAKAPEREMVLCQLVAQRVGKLSSFTVGGQAFDAATLDECNAKAK